MPQFIIERTIPGAGQLTTEQLAEIAGASNTVVAGLGVPYRWITSYVAGDKIYCIHETESAETIYEHANCGGFPADLVTPISAEFGPQSASASAVTS
jgi:Protein of unknown function (DUF4242)